MAELTIKDLGIAQDRQVEDPETEAFHKRASMAAEPILQNLTIGQRWDVFYPYCRVCEVIAVGDASAVVKASQSGNRKWPGKQWHETWAVRMISEKIPGGGKVDKPHVVVVEDSRSPESAQGTGTTIVALDPKTKQQHRHNLSIVMAVLREDDAIQTEVAGEGPVQGNQQPDGESDEQEAQDTQGSDGTSTSTVRKRPGRPKGQQSPGVKTS